MRFKKVAKSLEKIEGDIKSLKNLVRNNSTQIGDLQRETKLPIQHSYSLNWLCCRSSNGQLLAANIVGS